MFPVLKFYGLLFHEVKIGLMHKGRSLQGVTGVLVAKVAMGDLPKLVVNHWDEAAQRFPIPILPLGQEFADGLGWELCHGDANRDPLCGDTNEFGC